MFENFRERLQTVQQDFTTGYVFVSSYCDVSNEAKCNISQAISSTLHLLLYANTDLAITWNVGVQNGFVLMLAFQGKYNSKRMFPS